jgi:hypothetical protein
LMAGPTGAGSARTHASQQCTPAENIAGIGPAVYFKILRDIANSPEYLFGMSGQSRRRHRDGERQPGGMTKSASLRACRGDGDHRGFYRQFSFSSGQASELSLVRGHDPADARAKSDRDKAVADAAAFESYLVAIEKKPAALPVRQIDQP